MSDKPSFFAELKRRNVLRAAAFYALVQKVLELVSKVTEEEA